MSLSVRRLRDILRDPLRSSFHRGQFLPRVAPARLPLPRPPTPRGLGAGSLSLCCVLRLPGGCKSAKLTTTYAAEALDSLDPRRHPLHGFLDHARPQVVTAGTFFARICSLLC